MSVEFESDLQRSQAQFASRSILGQPQVPSMASWLIKRGIIKEESQAKGVLFGIICFNFIVTGLVIFFFIL
jgi:hypothetical protein